MLRVFAKCGYRKNMKIRLIRTDKLSKYQFTLCVNAHAACS
nr:MAG TPA: hypothetical protein [Bacteriophage sp.]